MTPIALDERLSLDLPVLDAKDLTAASLRERLARNGCCQIRNLLRMSDVLMLRDLAERTYQEFDAGAADALESARNRPQVLINRDAYCDHLPNVKIFRQFGSIPMSYCAVFTEALCSALERTAVPPALSAWFGARVGVSLNASSVRYSELDNEVRRVFHQDGNFLGGEAAQTVNCWIALDPCGRDAPGLEVFPFRVDRLIPAGGDGAIVPWEIEESLTYRELGADRSWIPEFQPGDAFLFDHQHVHRTHKTDAMTRSRYAIECWMFPSLKRHQSKLLAWLENA